MEGNTELNMEGVSNVGSEMDRIHIAEKNKAMAAKLKVCVTWERDRCFVIVVLCLCVCSL